MTPTEVQAVIAQFKYLWPKVRWGDGDFDTFGEGAERVNIEPDQAEAAMRNLKRSTDKYPTVAAVLRALKLAEAKPVRTAEKAVQTAHMPEIEMVDGLTSFEWRVIQDPRFREFARKHGRLPAEREAWIDEQARMRGVTQ